jgi:uncharacterized protein (DUF58 family)
VTGTRRTSRWGAVVGPAALLVAVGLWTGEQVLVLAAVVPLGYLAYGSLATVPDVTAAVSVTRELSVDTPYPGEHVDVTVRVTNESDAVIPDLRVVDDVPGGVEPIDGETEAILALRPGESATVEYTLVAQRGSHEFGSVALRARGLSAAVVSSGDVRPAGDSSMVCRVHVEDAPIREQTMRFVGAIPTATGGAGVEFHSTRRYRRGDPMNRIDWRRLAKTGELTTIDYRVQEAARVLVVVDARDAVAVSAGPEYPDSRELSSYAAELLVGVLLDDGHEAGVATIGMDLPGTRGTGDLSVLEPSGGEAFRAHVAAVCSAIAKGDPSAATDPNGRGRRRRSAGPAAGDRAGGAVSQTAASGGEEHRRDGGVPRTDGGGCDTAGDSGLGPGLRSQLAELRGFLGQHTQVLFVTPALDDVPVTMTETLEAHGHAVAVLSPDVTDRETLGGRLARVRRRERIEDLRETGATVVDWPISLPLPLAVSPALRGVG